MDYSTRISERMWNQPDKGELEAERENTFIDDIVQKAHIEKELLSNLDCIGTVFDGGAGCGRFSILLAKRGLKVTHFDISRPMIDKARELAEKEGVLDRITFVQGVLEDLSAYEDRSFDLVMSFDSPISYTYPHQEKTISELVRLARKRIMISVSSRLGALPYLANPIQKNQFILDKDSKDGWVQWCLSSREQMIEAFSFSKDTIMKTYETGLFGDLEESKKAYDRGEAPWSISYHFMPDELKAILEKNGVKNVELAGPGAFARTIPNEILVKIVNNSEQRKQFLEFCHMYDSNPYVCGMGKDNLFAKGEIEDEN
ncbi:MAG: methyltransferase domain-containing protein [Lachnospiraceae bacterium]|nr:methyltransferase domain-containing protein [Lachnospiraceae bacterium]